MIIIRITPSWYVSITEVFGSRCLFFGYSFDEVAGKASSYRKRKTLH